MLAQSILYKPAGNGTLWQTPLSVNKEETNIVQYNQVCYSLIVHNEELCSHILWQYSKRRWWNDRRNLCNCIKKPELEKKPLFLLGLSTVPHQYPSWESCKLPNVAAVDQHLCVGMGSLWRDQEKTDQKELSVSWWHYHNFMLKCAQWTCKKQTLEPCFSDTLLWLSHGSPHHWESPSLPFILMYNEINTTCLTPTPG